MFKYQIRGENIAVTDAIREYAERKISKLEKYFDSQDATVHVNAKVYPNKKQKAEVTIPLKGVTLRAEETSMIGMEAWILLSINLNDKSANTKQSYIVRLKQNL